MKNGLTMVVGFELPDATSNPVHATPEAASALDAVAGDDASAVEAAAAAGAVASIWGYAAANEDAVRGWARNARVRFAKHFSYVCVTAALVALYKSSRWRDFYGVVSCPADCVMNLWLWQYFLTKEEARWPVLLYAAAGATAALTALKVVSSRRPTFFWTNAYVCSYYALLFCAAPLYVARRWRSRTGKPRSAVDWAALVLAAVAIGEDLRYMNVGIGALDSTCPAWIGREDTCFRALALGICGGSCALAVCARRGLSPELLVVALWITQIVPLYGGDILLYNVVNASVEDVMLFAAVYWSLSSVFIWLIKRLGAAALGSHDEEDLKDVLLFPIQFAFDLFFTLLFIEIRFPRPSFFGLLGWQFVTVVFRDGGYGEQAVLCATWLGKRGETVREDLRSAWRLLAINNTLSEAAATLAVIAAVGFDAFLPGARVIVSGASRRERERILAGLGLALVALKAAHRTVWKENDLRYHQLEC